MKKILILLFIYIIMIYCCSCNKQKEDLTEPNYKAFKDITSDINKSITEDINIAYAVILL